VYFPALLLINFRPVSTTTIPLARTVFTTSPSMWICTRAEWTVTQRLMIYNVIWRQTIQVC